MRTGSYYRRAVLQRLGICLCDGWVLDAGGHDGSVLRAMAGARAVVLDLAPVPTHNATLSVVRGDGKRPPFPAETFTAVFALDVLEHEPDDAALMSSLLDMVAPGGTLWLSVPSRDFRAVPSPVTAVLHLRWGHVRPGYTEAELRRLVPEGWQGEIMPWNEPAFRFVYLPVRALWPVLPMVAKLVLRWAAVWDARHQCGEYGHLFAKVRRLVAS